MNPLSSFLESVFLSDIANQLRSKNSPQAKKAVKAWDYFLDLDLSVTPKSVSTSALNNARQLLRMCQKQYHLSPIYEVEIGVLQVD